MSRIIRCTQQSDLWLAAKVGRISASGVDALLAPPTTRQSTRKGVVCPAGTEALELAEYREKLRIERIYGRAVNNYVTKAMDEGIENEPYARMLYEAAEQVVVLCADGSSLGLDQPTGVGFMLHPNWDWFGCSPDGLIGDDGGVELKCPQPTAHDAYAANIDLLVQEYKGQVLSCLVCFPERQWWDLASFQPYAPDALKLLKAPRFHRSDWQETIDLIEDKAEELNEQIEEAIAKRGLPPTQWGILPDSPAIPREPRKSTLREQLEKSVVSPVSPLDKLLTEDLPAWAMKGSR
jgi:hypothetical protein